MADKTGQETVGGKDSTMISRRDQTGQRELNRWAGHHIVRARQGPQSEAGV